MEELELYLVIGKGKEKTLWQIDKAIKVLIPLFEEMIEEGNTEGVPKLISNLIIKGYKLTVEEDGPKVDNKIQDQLESILSFISNMKTTGVSAPEESKKLDEIKDAVTLIKVQTNATSTNTNLNRLRRLKTE